MGVLYVVVPLDTEAAAWLDSEGIGHPQPSPENRNPTREEIVEVLSELPDYKFDVRCENGSWYADVSCAMSPSTGPWTEIVVRDYRSSDQPHGISFTKGWLEIILLVTERLTRYCGPLVITDDSCALPYLVQPGMVVERMIAEYNVRQPHR
jgi:hypothetical protein